MDSKRLKELYGRYQSDQLDADELREWQVVITDLSFDEKLFALIDADWNRTDLAVPELSAQVREVIYQGIVSQPQKPRTNKTLPLWERWRIAVGAAAAVALLTLGFYFYNYNKGPFFANTDLTALDLDPGKVGATLTLASGKKIRLTEAANGRIAEEAGMRVSKTAEGQLVYELANTDSDKAGINTLSTEKGETYILVLPDKTKVWLNAASSLSYSASLNDRGIRRVSLKGEAFFQVSKDKARPFVVQTAKQEVEVLGTQFNINSYEDEAIIATTLVEGSVKVKDGNRRQIIVPGQQLMNNGTDFEIAKVNLDHVTDWKEGEFNLDGLAFPTAMRKIARWYNVEVIYDASVPDNIISGGWISRETKLSTILEVIQRSKQVHFKLKGRKLYVSK